jgi:hypothetical protein
MYHDGSLYVNESLRKRSISIFDASLEFEKRVDIPFNVGVVNFAAYNGDLLIPLLEIEVPENPSLNDPPTSSFVLTLIDPDVPTERPEPPFGTLTEQRTTTQLWKNLGFVQSRDDLVVFAYYFRGILEIFDTAVSTHRVVELPIDGDLGMEEDDILGRERPTAAPIRAHVIDNEHIFVLGGTFSDELSQTVMVLNRLGDHIGNVALDAGGAEIESFDVRDGHIYYTTEDAIMTKLRYDVEALSST